MGEIRIVTDSTANLTQEEIEKYNIEVVQLYLLFKTKHKKAVAFLKDSDLDRDLFYQSLIEDKNNVPEPYQPYVQDIVDVYKKLQNEGTKIIFSIHISSKISGTIEETKMARLMVPGINIFTVDSKTTSTNLGYLVKGAAKLAMESKNYNEIFIWLNKRIMSQETLVTLNNIDYLRWGRWASGWKSKFISFFNYKQLALFQGSFDNLTIMENSKSIKTNIEKMYEWCINKNKSKKIEQINIAHTYIEKETAYLKNMLLKNFEETKINIIEMSPSLGAYIGPGAIELTIN